MTSSVQPPIVTPMGDAGGTPVRGGRLPHVGALDGLRAVSLIAVLLYHGGFGWAKGGFLGVSTFFTLSGFLITSLLLVENHQNGQISLRRFWSAPGPPAAPGRAVMALVLVAAFALFAATPTQITGLRGDLLSVVRHRHQLAAGALRAATTAPTSPPPSPVQHVWSLAVEEQFYLFLPLLVVFAAHRSKRPQQQLAILAAVLGLASTVALLLSVPSDGNTTWAYYATHTRAAELLAGVFLACTVHHLASWRWRPYVVPVLGVIAAIGLVVVVGAGRPGLADALPRWPHRLHAGLGRGDRRVAPAGPGAGGARGARRSSGSAASPTARTSTTGRSSSGSPGTASA